MKFLVFVFGFVFLIFQNSESLFSGKYDKYKRWDKKPLSASEKKANSLKVIYSSLDPTSLSQYFAFYNLYKDTKEGKLALEHIWKLLKCSVGKDDDIKLSIPRIDISAMISLLTRQSFEYSSRIDDSHLNIIEELSKNLSNRKLKGNSLWSIEDIKNLNEDEIDLARIILIHQFENSVDDVRQYEAMLDLMSLQIFAKLPENPSHEDKIRAINAFIFQEMQFRFPPHSLYAKNIDVYTFLPSVIDKRQGVCLGVSVLYLCLAQRLDLPMVVITPPGHIFLRWEGKDSVINIETTARGINLPDDLYLSLNTHALQRRSIKEVVGLVFMNQAAMYLSNQDYQKSLIAYEKSISYIPNDDLLKMFWGLNYLFLGEIEKGEAILTPLKGVVFDCSISPETMPEDYLNGKINVDGMKTVFLSVDETGMSVSSKQKEIKKVLDAYPEFRSGLLQLATTYLQLGKESEALKILEKYHNIDKNDSTVEYYLAAICMKRYDYNSAWSYLKNTEKITSSKNHFPSALKSLRNSLRTLNPSSEKEF